MPPEDSRRPSLDASPKPMQPEDSGTGLDSSLPGVHPGPGLNVSPNSSHEDLPCSDAEDYCLETKPNLFPSSDAVLPKSSHQNASSCTDAVPESSALTSSDNVLQQHEDSDPNGSPIQPEDCSTNTNSSSILQESVPESDLVLTGSPELQKGVCGSSDNQCAGT